MNLMLNRKPGYKVIISTGAANPGANLKLLEPGH